MTTTTRTNATAPKGDIRNETLAQFDAMLTEHAGGDTGFGELVSGLFATRAAISQIDAARKAVYVHVKAAYDIGHTVVADTPYRLKMTTPPEPVVYQAVSSGDVKKRDPAAWRRAQALTNFVQVKAPAAVAAAVPEEAVPDTTGFMDPTSAVLTYKEHPAWVRLRELRAVEQETLGRLEKLAADFGWDGDLKVFSDGWSVQLKRAQFNADKLRELEPEVFSACAVTKVKSVTPHVIVGRMTPDGVEDYDAE